RIGLCAINRQYLVLLLLTSFLVAPANSFSQSPNAHQVSNEDSLFKALLAAKSESESKSLLQINRKLITENLWEKFKQQQCAAYNANDASRSIFLYRLEKQMAEELNDKSQLARILDKLGKIYLGIEDYETAKDYSQQSLKFAEELKDKQRSASV